MKEVIEKILDEYVPSKSEPFAGHNMGLFFRSTIPQEVYNTGIVNSQDYLVMGSVGQGNWATVPWICIFDKEITTSATKGIYIVYLLEKSGNSLYLTLIQGCTDVRKSHTKKETIQIMRDNATKLIASLDSRGFLSDENINLGEGLTELAELYQKGTIFYKEYKKVLSDIEEAKELIYDKDMAEFAREELSNAEEEKTRLESELEILLIPHDPNDEKNVIVEIRVCMQILILTVLFSQRI